MNTRINQLTRSGTALAAVAALALAGCTLTPPARPLAQNTPDDPDAPTAPVSPLNSTLVSNTRTYLPFSAGADAQVMSGGTGHDRSQHQPMDHSQHGDPSLAALSYVCPMHPDVTSPKPGECPKCGMSLVKRSAP